MPFAWSAGRRRGSWATRWSVMPDRECLSIEARRQTSSGMRSRETPATASRDPQFGRESRPVSSTSCSSRSPTEGQGPSPRHPPDTRELRRLRSSLRATRLQATATQQLGTSRLLRQTDDARDAVGMGHRPGRAQAVRRGLSALGFLGAREGAAFVFQGRFRPSMRGAFMAARLTTGSSPTTAAE
jgi:hypothetical protein